MGVPGPANASLNWRNTPELVFNGSQPTCATPRTVKGPVFVRSNYAPGRRPVKLSDHGGSGRSRTRHVRGGFASAAHARLRANCNRLLDVARETYKENVGDIFALNRTLTDTPSAVADVPPKNSRLLKTVPSGNDVLGT
ncbi:hypothetical protein B0H11DRAFT_2227345 [Mycena galericulata]|nr:hypothetical protein B0H11DRAFT_2227345 [Mycena galericulata]